MTKKRNYHYSDRSYCSVGQMICGTCGKPITQGPYRYYLKGTGDSERYITHHKDCCLHDPEWKKLEETEHLNLQLISSNLDDYLEFQKKYARPGSEVWEALQEDINELTKALNKGA